MMARSLNAPSIGRIQKRKTNVLQIIIFGLQRAAGPYRWVNSDRMKSSLSSPLHPRKRTLRCAALTIASGQERTGRRP